MAQVVLTVLMKNKFKQYWTIEFIDLMLILLIFEFVTYKDKVLNHIALR